MSKEKKEIRLPLEDRKRIAMSLLFEELKKTSIVPNKKKYKIKYFSNIKVNNKDYQWAYGDYNYDGDCNFRLFIFDDEERRIYNEEPVTIGDYNTDDIREIINTLNHNKNKQNN